MSACDVLASELDDAAWGAPPNGALATHLLTCAACAAQLERKRALAQRIDRAIGDYVRTEPSPGLAERIRARASTEQPRRWRNAWLVAPAAAALAAAALIVVSALGTHGPVSTTNLTALAAWRSPTASLLVSRSNVLSAPFTLRGRSLQ